MGHRGLPGYLCTLRLTPEQIDTESFAHRRRALVESSKRDAHGSVPDFCSGIDAGQSCLMLTFFSMLCTSSNTNGAAIAGAYAISVAAANAIANQMRLNGVAIGTTRVGAASGTCGGDFRLRVRVFGTLPLVPPRPAHGSNAPIRVCAFRFRMR